MSTGSGEAPMWTVDEARRITDAHPLLDGPGVGCELLLPAAADRAAVLATVRARLATLWPRLSLGDGALRVRPHAAGLSLALRAPPDRLYAAVDALEAALGAWPVDEAALRATLEAEANPALLALLEGCADLPVFVDDDLLTAGMGRHARSWPVRALPSLAEARAAAVRIPLALVTGTNGKTTTTRLVAAMARAAGLVAGHTSSDGVVVDGRWVEQGDWTGPGAARMVLRHPSVQVAILETARGGLLRRGLALGGAEVAAVTNISDDHLGEWGLDDLEAMAWAKLGVAAGVRPGGALVVHGRDPVLAAAALPRSELRVRRFADAPPAADLDAWTDQGALWLRGPDGPVRLLAEAQLPLALGGAVRFMVENALCAALVGVELGLPLDAVRAGLVAVQPEPGASRGRLNRFRLPGGGEAIVDFAHNPAGVRGLAGLVAAARPGRVAVLCGQAGDRPDALLDAYADAVADLRPDRVVLKELPGHRRGRAEGEVRARMRARLRARGVPEAALVDVPDEVQAAATALDATGPGDLALLLVHEELDAVLALLAARGAAPA